MGIFLLLISLPVVVIFGYMAYRNLHTVEGEDIYDYVLLALEIPRDNDKKELSAEQLFASLHGILRDEEELRHSGGIQEHLSFEIASVGGQIRFYVRVPKHLQTFVEGQIYAQYPTVQIRQVEKDYAIDAGKHSVTAVDELTLTDNEFFPIKTFQTFDVDPLAGITAALTKLGNSTEEIWVQILARPIPDSWQEESAKYINNYRNGTLGGNFWRTFFTTIASAMSSDDDKSSDKVELSDRDKLRISEAETKSQKLGYKVRIRVAYLGSDRNSARIQMNAVASAFKQFNSTSLNGFKLASQPNYDRSALDVYAKRSFPAGTGFILNIEELASVFHLPHTNVDTPNVVWASSKTAEPPTNLPVITGDPEHDRQISAFGLTNFRGMQQQFGIYRRDRSRHVYIIGQTGTGKSGLLELLALSDIYHNKGYAIIDPHGDFAVDNMRFIPPERIKDVIYFNPADVDYPLGFNPMEVYDPAQRNNISSEVIGVLKRMFGESWGPRLEYILRYTILALLEYPNTTMLDINRMLTNKDFRNKVLAKVTDTVVLQFWRVEFAGWNDRYVSEAIAPVLNKVGAFTANPIIRNIIGQPKSTFDIRKIMDEGKILIVNLSKGLIGEDNASILGSFLVTKIQLAAMSRSDIPRVEDRRPFYLYVDEFQNFATDSFAVILSEARKYGLNLTVANQYISQMSDNVRDAVFGNVGTMISMRVSAEDAPVLAQQFAPQFEAQDILQMNNRHFVCNMMIQGEKMPAFSGTTLKLPEAQKDYLDEIVANTRKNYARPKAEVEKEISDSLAIPEVLMTKTAREKLKKQRKEEAKHKTGDYSGDDNNARNTSKRQPITSPSGVSGSQNLGDLMKQIRQAAEGDNPSSMKLEDTRNERQKREAAEREAAEQSSGQKTAESEVAGQKPSQPKQPEQKAVEQEPTSKSNNLRKASTANRKSPDISENKILEPTLAKVTPVKQITATKPAWSQQRPSTSRHEVNNFSRRPKYPARDGSNPYANIQSHRAKTELLGDNPERSRNSSNGVATPNKPFATAFAKYRAEIANGNSVSDRSTTPARQSSITNSQPKSTSPSNVIDSRNPNFTDTEIKLH